MGNNYPAKYPLPAIVVAENIIKQAQSRLQTDGNGIWKCPHYFLSARELNEIHLRFEPGYNDENLLRFIGLVFSKVAGLKYFMCTSDGYFLKFGGSKKARTVVLAELPKATSGYRFEWQQEARAAALNAVHALTVWELTRLGGKNGKVRWPITKFDINLLIPGKTYQTIKALAQIHFSRTSKVVEFFYEAVPDIKAQWEAEGLKLVPVYHTDGDDRIITLELRPSNPSPRQ